MDLISMARKNLGITIKFQGYNTLVKIYVDPRNDKVVMQSDEMARCYPETFCVSHGTIILLNGHKFGNIEKIEAFSDIDIKIVEAFKNKRTIEFSCDIGSKYMLFNKNDEWYLKILSFLD